MPLSELLSLLWRRTDRHHLIPEGRRVYAIGDIHGRLDLLERLLEMIANDESTRTRAETTIVFLGDLIDRGPQSCGVIDRLLAFSKGKLATQFLTGNHEEVFLRAVAGDARAMRLLVRIGGRETILSYGISEEEYHSLDYKSLSDRLASAVPPEHLAFLSSFDDWIAIGGYLFVHAGLRPGIAVENQASTDLRWIRGEFLRCRSSFGKIVVHGHTVTNEIEIRHNRIGLDTGAYFSGKLSAIGLEGNSRWMLST